MGAKVGAALGLAVLVGLIGPLLARPAAFSQPLASIGIDQEPLALALDEPADRLFILNAGANGVSTVDAASAALLHTVPLAQVPSGAVAVAAGRVFVPTNAGPTGPATVAVLDAASGLPRRTLAGGRGRGVAAADERGDYVVLASSGGAALQILATRGARRPRTLALGSGATALAVDARTGHVFVLSDGMVAGGASASLPGKSIVRLLAAASGAVVRTVTVGYEAGALAVDGPRQRVFVANDGDGTVTTLDARSGAVVRTAAVARGPAILTLNQRRGRLLVLIPGASRLGVLDTGSGRLVGTLPVPGQPVTLALDERANRIFVLTQNPGHLGAIPPGCAALVALDGSTGRQLGVAPVGADPTALALDERRGRAFVASIHGCAQAPGGWRGGLAGVRRWWPWWPLSRPPAGQAPATGTLTVLDTTRL